MAYQYEPIDHHTEEFRLLRLHSGKPGEPIRCDVFFASLDDDPIPYNALSYTWGSEHKPHEILLNESHQTFGITSNLHEALLHIRDERDDQIMWIDAICIDQHNWNERGHQVQRMGKIFQKADRVMIWLGSGTSETDELLDFMQLTKLSAPEASYATTWELHDFQRRHHTSETEVEMREQHIAQYQLLLQRSWWTRAWVIQEVFNARASTIVCGTRKISSRIFSNFHTIMCYTTTLAVVHPHCLPLLDVMQSPSRRERCGWWSSTPDLRTLLLQFGRTKATLPVDRIFALLGLAKDVTDSSRIKADYGLSHATVVAQVISLITPFTLTDAAVVPQVLKDSAGKEPSCIVTAFFDLLPELEHVLYEHVFRKDLSTLLNISITPQLLRARNRTKETFVHTLLKVARLNPAHSSFDAAEVLRPLRHMYDINAQDNMGISPLMLALQHPTAALVEFLIAEPGIDVNLADASGRTALIHAARKSNPRFMHVLLKCPQIDVNRQDKEGRSALMVATAKQTIEHLRLLLDMPGINFNSRDKAGNAAVNIAARDRPFIFTQEFLECDWIQGHERMICASLALVAAVVCSNVTLLAHLLRNEYADVALANVLAKPSPPLAQQAIMNDSADTLRTLLTQKDIFVNSKRTEFDTPLNIAISKNRDGENVQMLTMLLEDLRVKVNERGPTSDTPLAVAIRSGAVEAVESLLSRADIDVNKPGSVTSPYSPLHLALKAAYVEDTAPAAAIVRLLLEDSRVDVNHSWDMTPLHYAINVGRLDLVTMLLNRADLRLDAGAWSATRMDRKIYILLKTRFPAMR